METDALTRPRWLSPQEYAVASAYALDGLSIPASGEALGLTVETVKSYLKRVRVKFRERGVDASSQLLLRLALLDVIE